MFLFRLDLKTGCFEIESKINPEGLDLSKIADDFLQTVFKIYLLNLGNIEELEKNYSDKELIAEYKPIPEKTDINLKKGSLTQWGAVVMFLAKNIKEMIKTHQNISS